MGRPAVDYTVADVAHAPLCQLGDSRSILKARTKKNARDPRATDSTRSQIALPSCAAHNRLTDLSKIRSSASQDRTLQREEAAMSGGSDPRWDDPRDRDDESLDIEIHWIELGRGPASGRPSEE